MATPRTTAQTLNDVALKLVPHLRIVSASQPTRPLRTHNVIAIAGTAEDARRAVLALEGIEADDDKLGTVVLGTAGAPSDPPADDGQLKADPEGVGRDVMPRILIGAIAGAIVGALIVGGGALLFGAEGWEFVGAAAAGAMLVSVFGAIWVSFAGFGGSDAYRQTFVDNDVSELTLVSIHTDDPREAAAARDRLDALDVQVADLDRQGAERPHPLPRNQSTSSPQPGGESAPPG